MIKKMLLVGCCIALLLLFTMQEEPAKLKEHVIRNPWYIFSWDDDGNIMITDPEQYEILSNIEYVAEYGEIYNALQPAYPKGSASIVFDQSPSMREGSTIEIRSESYAGRLNKPLVHQAKVTKVVGNEVHFAPPLALPIDRNVFVKQEQTRVQDWTQKQVQASKTDTGWTVTMIGKTPVSVVTTQYHLDQNSPMIGVIVNTSYQKDVKVFREALDLTFKPQVSEVYRKNRIVDTWWLQSAYWLDREGVRFGSGNRCAFLYHTPEVSSLELYTDKKELLINLDHMNDHHYVQQTENNRVGKVRHPSEYRATQKRTNSFSLVVGYQPKVMPRFMTQPDGYLATHVWTEHADEQSLETNRAIYFGSEKITDVSKAVGGFVKYGIPVTKSVFYSNPYYKPDERSSIAIKQRPDFLSFLDQLHANGNEIVLHTLYPFEFRHYQPTTEEAMSFMKNRFNSVTWIDHGYLKSSFAFNGLDIKTPNYMANMWEKYDTRYFWHYSSEDTGNINTSFDLYQNRRNDAQRTPLYWSHPTVTGPFYTWAALVVPEDTLDQYTGKHLYDLVRNRGVLINHTYLARIPTEKRGGHFIGQDAKGDWVIQPSFDKVLQRMAALRDRGDLYLTTVGDIMNYWLDLSHVQMAYAPNGAVYLKNESGHPIKGLSMATRSQEVYVNGKKPLQREANGDLVFWFDLAPGEYAVIADTPADSLYQADWNRLITPQPKPLEQPQ